MTALSLREVEVRFGGRVALAIAALDVEAGAIVGVIGPNGAGKTTLLDAISGFVPTSAASVRLDGTTELRRLPAPGRARRGIGRTFQDSRLFPSMRVVEVLRAAVEQVPGHRSRSRLDAEVRAMVDAFGLDRVAGQAVGELSTGTRRLVELACTRARRPRLALLDEPSAGVARAELAGLGEVLRTWRDEDGCALLVVEHDLAFLSTVADEVLVLGAGRVVTRGPTDAVLAELAEGRS